MGSAKMIYKLTELDRLVNDPDTLLDAARVYDLLDELSAEDLSLPVSPFEVAPAPVPSRATFH